VHLQGVPPYIMLGH